jgi:uncharacterized membrane protein YbjE (DUF340 family)
MVLIITALILGILTGYFRLLSVRIVKYTKPVSLIGLFLLIFLLGVKVGSEPRVTQQLGIIGKQGLVIAVCTVLGSIIIAYPIEKWLKRNAIKKADNQSNLLVK